MSNKAIQLIGITGHAQSGKDTLGKLLQKELNKGYILTEKGWQIKQFSTKVKEVVALLTNMPACNLNKNSVKNVYLDKEWDLYNYGIGKSTSKEILSVKYKEQHGIEPTEYYLTSQKHAQH
jgi:hypothetical protein